MSHSTDLPNGWVALHNGDYSGDVTFSACVGHEVAIPCEVVLAFAAEFIRGEKIAQLEQAETRQLLGLEDE